MAFDDLLRVTGICASGMSAERMQMEVVANNIANAYSTHGPGGGPFRRQDLLFSAVLDRHAAGRTGGSVGAGVKVDGLADDQSELPRLYNPGHPDADSQGYVTMPNVRLPIEMVNLMAASRAYEANMRAFLFYKQMVEQSLALVRS